MKPRFSVIIPVYNKEKDVGNTIQSLLKQTFSSFEAIIVDDGSTDNSKQIVSQFKDPRIQVFSKNNEGVSIARNFAVSKANASYIAFLDADDYWFPNHLENLDRLISSFPDIMWFATAYGKKHSTVFTSPMKSPLMEKPKNWMGIVDNFFINSLSDCVAWTSAVCFNKVFFEKLGGFDPTNYDAGEDTDLWIRAAIAKPLAFSRNLTTIHNLNASNRLSKIETRSKVYLNLNKYEPYTTKSPGLKKYLDINRFSIALQYKIAGDKQRFLKKRNEIDFSSLTKKQRFLIRQPRTSLRLFLVTKRILLLFGINLSSFG